MIEIDIKVKKNYLFKYKNAIKCEERIKEKISDIETKLNSSIKSGDFSKEGTSSGINTEAPFTRLIAKKEEYENRLKRTQEKSEAIKEELLIVIDKVNNPMYVEILEGYFIELKSVEEICKDIDRSQRHWYRLYKSAILSIEI